MNNENQLTFEKIWKEARDKQADRGPRTRPSKKTDPVPDRKSEEQKDSGISEEATGRESTYGGL